jgi:DNA-binding Lrp family transcriptional regulator
MLPDGTWECGTRDAAILFKPNGSVSLKRGSRSLKADWRSLSGRLGGIDESIQFGAQLDPVVNELLWLHHGGAQIEPAKTSSDYVIIRLVRDGLSSAAHIAAEMGISKATVIRRAAGLVKAGYLVKLGTCYMLGSMVGAPPTPEVLKSLREITSANDDDEAKQKLSEFSRRIRAARALIKNPVGPYEGFFRSLKKLAKELRRPPYKGELAKELGRSRSYISKICETTGYDWLPTDKPGPK